MNRPWFYMVGMMILLLVLIVVSLCMGIIPISAGDFLHLTEEQERILYFIRLPRILVAISIGMALAIAGAVMQGVFGNPLADPGIMGVVSGASTGGCDCGSIRVVIGECLLHAILCIYRRLDSVGYYDAPQLV